MEKSLDFPSADRASVLAFWASCTAATGSALNGFHLRVKVLPDPLTLSMKG